MVEEKAGVEGKRNLAAGDLLELTVNGSLVPVKY